MNRIRRCAVAVLAALSCLAAGAQGVEDYPARRPISFIVGFGAGGSTDILARLIAPALKDQLGQALAVENKPGASGALAAEALLRAPADGYTIMACTNSVLTTHKYLFKNLSFDADRDILPVAQLSTLPYVLLVHPKVNVGSARELVALARAKPNALAYGSAGAGSAGHLAGAMFASSAGIQLNHVPYRGSGPMATDLVAGHLDLSFDQEVTFKNFIADGRLKALAIASPERSPTLPDVPTLKEAGYPFEAAAWTGICVRAGTPEPVVRRIADAVHAVMSRPEIRDRVAQLGMIPKNGSRQQFQELVRNDSRRLGAAIQAMGIKAE